MLRFALTQNEEISVQLYSGREFGKIFKLLAEDAKKVKPHHRPPKKPDPGLCFPTNPPKYLKRKPKSKTEETDENDEYRVKKDEEEEEEEEEENK
ncbi:hypothetical protein TIFTF001_033338 [Ficus carica]|uniref:Uncharacterized protein n=1 Tax=Ficus carica TaxID=3494 RepID=A0AA88DYQ3_FICCA|nr:hypothetical protein TIFTF001_033338 [Ficus carica]